MDNNVDIAKQLLKNIQIATSKVSRKGNHLCITIMGITTGNTPIKVTMRAETFQNTAQEYLNALHRNITSGE